MRLILSLLIVMTILSYGATKSKSEREDKIYYLQHRLLPKYIFDNRDLYEALAAKKVAKFLEVVGKVVDKKYANNLHIEHIASKNAVLITFPAPTKSPLCYFAFIQKFRDGFSYYVYEKVDNILGGDVVGVVGAWSENKEHFNFGLRNYKDSKSFINDLTASSSSKPRK